MTSTAERPGPIHAVPVRHPGRWVAAGVILILVAMFIHSLVTNPRWEWGFAFRVMNYAPVLQGLWVGTVFATVASMVIGIVLGVILAVMRLSRNPILKWTSAAYTWFFRAIPRYVLLTILGVGLVYLYPKLDIGIPFGQELSRALGLGWDMTFFEIDMRSATNGIGIGILGLALSEAAYMAEIARAGILSVDRGQTEAGQALGMSNSLAMRRIVLPQAMRVIIPPTGNETIAMVKDTSLLTAIPIMLELFNQVTIIANRTYKVMPAYMAATLWYLIVCSVLMVGQYFLERHFGKGFSGHDRQHRADRARNLMALTGDH